MLSPLDLQNKKIITRKKKYDKAEIDDYIDLLLENYKEAFNEVQELQKKVKTLSDGIQYYRSIESTMQKALVLAEKTSKETKDAALLKAEAIEKDASTRASRIVADAEQEYEKIKDKCVSLAQQFNQYKMQLRQVAAAQLELVTSESFDVYSPELDALQASRNSLPPVNEPEAAVSFEQEIPHPIPADMDRMTPEEESADDIRLAVKPGVRTSDLLVDEAVMDSLDNTSPETDSDLDKTLILPDLKHNPLKDVSANKDSISVLTADTIDLRDSIQQIQREEIQRTESEINIQKPVAAEPVQVRDALVMEPMDANPATPLDAELKDIKVQPPETLEPALEEPKQAQTLDSLLQSINIGGRNKKKKKKGQEEDPFEFLGSVDDF